MCEMSDCLFCKIINGEVPSTKVFENEYVYAFKDISPVAPVHVLFIPKEHISGVSAITPDNSLVVSKIYEAIAEYAHSIGLDESGYRVVSNCGESAGQTVMHLHFHLLGGEKLGGMV